MLTSHSDGVFETSVRITIDYAKDAVIISLLCNRCFDDSFGIGFSAMGYHHGDVHAKMMCRCFDISASRFGVLADHQYGRLWLIAGCASLE